MEKAGFLVGLDLELRGSDCAVLFLLGDKSLEERDVTRAPARYKPFKIRVFCADRASPSMRAADREFDRL